MTVAVSGDSITFPDNSVQATAPSGFGFKNRIINGACVIDQRNAGAVYTPTGGAITYGSVDRWQFAASQASKFTVQRNAGSVTPPAGFTNYLGAVSSSAYSVGATEQFNISQSIEGFNVADFGFGTANAVTVALSLWVRSSLTGTFGGVLSNDGKNRTYPFTYTISAANTWEYKTITVAGDTSGTWNTTTSNGLYVTFGLGVGSSASAAAGSWTGTANIFGATGATSVVGTNGATFYITGVQLEKGSTATSFDYRPYGTELGLCQRYYETVGLVNGIGQASANVYDSYIGASFKVTKRATPTVTKVSATLLNRTAGGVGATTGNVTATIVDGFTVVIQSSSGAGLIQIQDGQYTASAEL